MAIARVFKSGNSQAVRLPKQFRVKSTEVEIFRRGDESSLPSPLKSPAAIAVGDWPVAESRRIFLP